jgi:anti-sigma factor RsiW
MTRACNRIEPLLSAWLDRSLRGGERAAVDAHLPACEQCQAEVASLRRTSALLRAAPARSLPPDVRAALLSSAGMLPAGPPARPVVTRLVAVVLALLAALGVSVLALDNDRPGTQAPVPLDVNASATSPAPVLVETAE